MSDTPDTDEAQFGAGRVSVDFARRLERERNEERMRIEDVKKALQCIGCEGAILAALRVVEERDRAEELNARLREIISRANRDYDEQIELFRAECNNLRDIAERAIELAIAYYDGPCERDAAKLRAELDQLKSGK